MAIDLYAMDVSAPCRSVLLVMAALNLTPNFIKVDITGGDLAKPEFMQLSPQHTVPLIVDNGFTLTESRAIMRYLADKYGKDSGLVPDTAEERAVMNQMLDLDLGTVYQRLIEKYFYPLKYHISAGNHTGPNLDSAMLTLDLFLEGQDWAAGNKMTLADFALASTVASLVAIDYDITPYKNIQNWYSKAKNTMKGFDVNEAGAAKIKAEMKRMEAARR